MTEQQCSSKAELGRVVEKGEELGDVMQRSLTSSQGRRESPEDAVVGDGCTALPMD